MKIAFVISVIALAAGLGGCAVGPDYHRPAPLPGQPDQAMRVERVGRSNHQVVAKTQTLLHAEIGQHLARR